MLRLSSTANEVFFKVPLFIVCPPQAVCCSAGRPPWSSTTLPVQPGDPAPACTGRGGMQTSSEGVLQQHDTRLLQGPPHPPPSSHRGGDRCLFAGKSGEASPRRPNWCREGGREGGWWRGEPAMWEKSRTLASESLRSEQDSPWRCGLWFGSSVAMFPSRGICTEPTVCGPAWACSCYHQADPEPREQDSSPLPLPPVRGQSWGQASLSVWPVQSSARQTHLHLPEACSGAGYWHLPWISQWTPWTQPHWALSPHIPQQLLPTWASPDVPAPLLQLLQGLWQTLHPLCGSGWPGSCTGVRHGG